MLLVLHFALNTAKFLAQRRNFISLPIWYSFHRAYTERTQVLSLCMHLVVLTFMTIGRCPLCYFFLLLLSGVCINCVIAISFFPSLSSGELVFIYIPAILGDTPGREGRDRE